MNPPAIFDVDSVSPIGPGLRSLCRSRSARTDSGMVSDSPTVAVVGDVSCTALAQANLGQKCWAQGVKGPGLPKSSGYSGYSYYSSFWNHNL